MTRLEALQQLTAESIPALIEEMHRRGYAGDGNLDDVTVYVERWIDRITKTSAATLENMTDWREVLDHASGKDTKPRAAADLPADIIGQGFRIEFNGPHNGIQVLFDKFPTDEARKLTKAAGFYWSPTLKCWTRKITNKGKRAAEEFAAKLAALHLR